MPDLPFDLVQLRNKQNTWSIDIKVLFISSYDPNFFLKLFSNNTSRVISSENYFSINSKSSVVVM